MGAFIVNGLKIFRGRLFCMGIINEKWLVLIFIRSIFGDCPVYRGYFEKFRYM